MSKHLSSLETLEGRRHLSATLKGGVLRAVGDDGVENVITVKLNEDKSKYDVEINGATTSFDAKKVRRVVLHGAEMSDTLTVSGEINVRQNIFGYEGNDTLTGGSAADETAAKKGKGRGPRGWTRLWGMGGDDTIVATGGRNFIDGGKGNDNLTGSDGRDLIAGFTGSDTINAKGGDDVVHGGEGDDTIDLGAGNDKCLAGAGNDNVSGGDGDDRIFGQAGNDTLHGNAGRDRLFGQVGLDHLFGGDDNDDLYGGADADLLDGGLGTNRLKQGDAEETEALEIETTAAAI